MRNKNLTNTREVYSNQIFQQWKNYVANQVLHIAFLSYAGLKLKISKPIFPHDTKNVFSNQVSNFTPWFPRSLDCATPSTCLIKSLFSSIWLRNNTRLGGPHPAPVLPQHYHHLPGATALPRDTSAGCCPQAFRFVSSQRRNPPIKFTCSWPERRSPTFLRCWSQNVFFLVRRHLLSLAMGPNLLLERADSSPSEQLRSPGHRKLPASGATSTSLLAFTLVLPYCLHSVRIPCLFLKNKPSFHPWLLFTYPCSDAPTFSFTSRNCCCQVTGVTFGHLFQHRWALPQCTSVSSVALIWVYVVIFTALSVPQKSVLKASF